MRSFLLFALLPVAFASKYFEMYINLSLEWSSLLKEQPGFDEQQIHDLAKDYVAHSDDFRRVSKLYEKHLTNKSSEYQIIFTEKIVLPGHLAHVSERLQKIHGYYLTKAQIEKFRNKLVELMAENVGRDQAITALKEELSKDIPEEKASRAIDMLIKDLKVLYKVHGNVVTQADMELAYLVHDEL